MKNLLPPHQVEIQYYIHFSKNNIKKSLQKKPHKIYLSM